MLAWLSWLLYCFEKDYPKVTPELIKDALAHANWRGRTEFLRPNLMIDGAHNNESVKF